jgi:hypothetical protein
MLCTFSNHQLTQNDCVFFLLLETGSGSFLPKSLGRMRFAVGSVTLGGVYPEDREGGARVLHSSGYAMTISLIRSERRRK